jgi:hypothetical protein
MESIGKSIDTIKSRWFMRILWEKHHKLCSCSYCIGINEIKALHWGLNIPECRTRTSWWVFRLPWGIYARATPISMFNLKPGSLSGKSRE